MSGSFFAHFKLPGNIICRAGFVLPLLLFTLVMVACGSSSTSNGSANLSAPGQASSGQPAAATPGTGGSPTAGTPTLPNGTSANAYLIHTLAVTLVVNNPLDAEHQLDQDIFTMDPLAQGAGEAITQQSDGAYKVSITFAVSAAKYEAVKQYLGSFAATHPTYKGKLISEDETVQNVTTQYVDLQSQLKNLQTEQQRLLQLMSQAQNLSDMLTIQDKLTDVEGQIEQIEGQINELAGQTAYSMVTINLSSTTPPLPPPPAPPKKWNPGDIFSTAVSVMVAVLQVVADILIWVIVFAVFWLPILAGVYVWRRLRQRAVRPRPGASVTTS